jgi:hypothetical protein
VSVVEDIDGGLKKRLKVLDIDDLLFGKLFDEPPDERSVIRSPITKSVSSFDAEYGQM